MCNGTVQSGKTPLQLATKHIPANILRAWASPTMNGEILFVSLVSVAYAVDVLF